jgi:hypothetical protein
VTEEVRIGGDGDGEQLRSGLVTLVLAVVEILDDALENEAVRRMESGQLTDEEVERLGTQLRALDEEIRSLEEREGVADDVERLRGRLDDALAEAVRGLDGADLPSAAEPDPGRGPDDDGGDPA